MPEGEIGGSRDPMAGGLGEAYTSTLEDRIQLVLDFALRALHV